jgi:hypothetical protein
MVGIFPSQALMSLSPSVPVRIASIRLFKDAGFLGIIISLLVIYGFVL